MDAIDIAYWDKQLKITIDKSRQSKITELLNMFKGGEIRVDHEGAWSNYIIDGMLKFSFNNIPTIYTVEDGPNVGDIKIDFDYHFV